MEGEHDVETTTVEGGDTIGPLRGGDADALPPGSQIGRYVVMRELGAGAMGVVVQAYDPELDRTVAVKRLRPDGRTDAEEARRRLQREAQAMAKLQHPNVIAVHDVGMAHGELFVAMELVDGDTLRAWIRQRPPWPAVVDVFLQAGRGLAAAHRAGLVHRDFKPANVLIAKSGRVRVLDFGLVSHVQAGAMSVPPADVSEESTPGDDDLTRGGTILGTPGYMAPEQHLGRPADARSDIYAYCVSLFEGLYGDRPFSGHTLGALGRAKQAMQLIPIPERDVPPRIREVALKGLAVDPSERWPSMDALLEALERAAAPRRRWVWAAGLALTAAIAAAVAVQTLDAEARPCADAAAPLAEVWSDRHRARGREAFEATRAPFADASWTTLARSLDAYADEWSQARTAVCEATRVRSEQPEPVLRARMACLDHRLEELRTVVELAEKADTRLVERLPRAARRLTDVARCRSFDEDADGVTRPEDPRARARGDDARRRLARASMLYEAGQYADSIDAASEVVAELADGRDPAVAGEALLVLGSSQDRSGEAEDAEDTLHRALYAAQEARDRTTQARAWTRLAWVVGARLSRWDEGLRHAEHARAVADSMEPDPIRTMGILSTTGSIQFSAGRIAEALDHHRRALDVAESALGPNDPRLALPLLNLGLSHYAYHEPDRALQFYERALEIQRDTYGPDHPRVGTTTDNIGLARHALGRHEQAREAFERALAIRRAALGERHGLVALTLRHLGDVAFRTDDLDLAARRYDEASAIERVAYAGPDRRRAFTLLRRGEVLLARDDAEGALPLLQRALEMNAAVVPAEHPELAFPLTALGEAEARLGRPDAALEHLERATRLRADERDPVLRAQTDFARAQALAARGEAERADALARRAMADFARSTDPQRDRSAEVRRWLETNR